MTTRPRITYCTRAVLRVLVDAGPVGSWGWGICQTADLGPGTVYPILARLRDHGWADVTPETGPHPARPARQYWTLTDIGRHEAVRALGPRR